MTRPADTGAGAPLADESEPGGSLGDLTASFTADRPIALIGMPGSGKTTMGRRIAKAMNLEFRDADTEIQAACGGREIREIFAEWGEAEFRRIERQVVARLLRGEKPIVLATGGGAYMNAETRSLMSEVAVTIWLRADFEVLLNRVLKKRHKRPLLADNPRESLERLMRERTPIYSQADIVIESAAGPQARTMEAVLRGLAPFFNGERQAR